MKFTCNDRSGDVRKTFYQTVRHWLTSMELQAVRTYEKHLVLFLLNGVSDDQEEIRTLCTDTLETHGKNMEEALKALEEESPSKMDVE